MKATLRPKIRRRSTRSGIRWYVSVIHADGNEDAHGGYRTQGEAKAKAREILGRADNGKYVAPKKLTVREYLTDEWREARKAANLSENSRDVERLIVDAWIVPHIGDLELQAVTARDLDRLYTRLRSSGGRGGRPLRGKSVVNTHQVIAKAFADAVRRGHMIANPCLAVDRPARDDSVERTAWNTDEAIRFLAVASNDRLAAVWRLALASGMRRGELAAVTWSCLDFDKNNVIVRRQVLVRPQAQDSPRVYVRETTKTRRYRTVRVDPMTIAALKRWKVDQGEERLAFGPAYARRGGLSTDIEDWIVTEADGKVVHPETLLRRWKALVKVAGVTPIPIHGARHTFAELSLKSGARLDVVSRQVGHAGIATTANVYLHDDQEAAAEAAVKLGNALGEYRGNG